MKKLIVNLSFCRWLLLNPLQVIKFREEKMIYRKKSKPSTAILQMATAW